MPGFRGADHIDDAGQRCLRGAPGDLYFETPCAVNGAGKNLVRRFDVIGIVRRGAYIVHRRFVDRGAFAGDGRLVDAAFAFDDEPVGGNTVIGANNHNVARFQFVNR